MPNVPTSNVSILSYHAHVYYRDDASRAAAASLREAIAARFEARLGRWRDAPVGPHPEPMYQVAFDAGLFPEIVPWLMLNRRGLTVFVHPETGDDLADHRDHALWMGRMLPLRLEVFEGSGSGRPPPAR